MSSPSAPAVSTLVCRPDDPVTRHELTRLGISNRELTSLVAAGHLERVVRGVYGRPLVQPTPEASYLRTVRAVALLRNTTACPVLTGPAALVVHGLPLLGRPPSVVHVASAQSSGDKPNRLVRAVGEVPADRVVDVGGVLVARAADAVVDTARLLTVEAAAAAADAGLRRGLVSVAELDEVCATRSGRTGVARARRAVRLATPLSESPGESWSAVVMDALGIPEPQRQEPLCDEDGFVGRVDFWWPGRHLAGEFDGRVKYGRTNPSGRPPEDVLWSEKLREDRLRHMGVRVVRWTTTDLTHPTRLAARLLPALGDRHRPQVAALGAGRGRTRARPAPTAAICGWAGADPGRAARACLLYA